jgi:hypothetical protein
MRKTVRQARYCRTRKVVLRPVSAGDDKLSHRERYPVDRSGAGRLARFESRGNCRTLHLRGKVRDLSLLFSTVGVAGQVVGFSAAASIRRPARRRVYSSVTTIRPAPALLQEAIALSRQSNRDGRQICSQLNSRRAARLVPETCPAVGMDGDRNGIAGENGARLQSRLESRERTQAAERGRAAAADAGVKSPGCPG